MEDGQIGYESSRKKELRNEVKEIKLKSNW
jgi:hypothetical protein